MSRRDRTEFNAYLRICTDLQVFGVIRKERDANRRDYLALAIAEAKSRGLSL